VDNKNCFYELDGVWIVFIVYSKEIQMNVIAREKYIKAVKEKNKK